MEFLEQLRGLAAEIPQQLEHIRTEEATKTALIMPFISAMGYNVFNPAEVTPEYVADVGIKQGEKVDYAIKRNGKPIILIECKAHNANLDKLTESQLYRYFSVSEARFGIFTNGIRYLVYSDLDEPNKMDTKPFLELDMTALDEIAVEQFKLLTKPLFDVDKVISNAQEYRYTQALKAILAAELREPSEDFVRTLAARVYNGKITQVQRERFALFIKNAFAQFLNDQINERLRIAMAVSDATAKPAPADASAEAATPEKPAEPKIVTSADELNAYLIIKAIVREVIDAKRVSMRDNLSYCSIVVDERKTGAFARLYFNSAKKRIVIFNAQKQEETYPIESLDDLYAHADKLKAAALAAVK